MKLRDQIGDICKCFQMCLETCYWNCIEERFCFDKDIATCKLEENISSQEWEEQHCYTNRAVSLESIVTRQPPNNNSIPPLQQNGIGRELQELPVMASQIYEVFSKSMIFRDNAITQPDIESFKDDISNKVSPPVIDFSNGKTNRIVSFEDEVIEAQNDLTDFEIMFRDELLADQRMTKIEEEDEHSNEKLQMQPSPEDPGLTMKPLEPYKPLQKVALDNYKDEYSPKEIKLSDVKFGIPLHKTKLDDVKFGIPLHKTKSDANIKLLPRLESVKGILRVNSLKSIPHTSSTGTLNGSDSSINLNRPERKISRIELARVESLKNIDTRNINKILSRLPQRSASFLSIPEHILQAEKERLKREVFAISDSKFGSGEFSQLSHMPDTPVIKSTNLPKFFEETPVIPAYKAATSLKSLQKPGNVIFTEYDYSMPRYYGKANVTNTDNNTSIPSVHESKSMPDLTISENSRKVSKRLVKLRSKLKPLVIKKSGEDNSKG